MPTVNRCVLPLLALSVAVTSQQNDTAPTVTLESGSVRGLTTQVPGSSIGVNQYFGIPYAQPPVDSLRFSPPREVDDWAGILEATAKRNTCIQYLGREGPARDRRELLFNIPDAPMSEDCLYLDVYVPHGGEANKSVLFWIHGGSGYMGSASWPDYDGSIFAGNQDIIVVSANYRLNVFGNPRGAPIPVEEANIGQLDTNMALNWTSRNIAQFGGDPSKITIMGESAGAISVGNLVNTSPHPLFRAAIEMSGSAIVTPPDLGGSDPDVAWTELVELLNCTGVPDATIIECVRRVPADRIRSTLEENEIVFSTPPHNNITSLERPDISWAARDVAKVPLLIGYTADDGSIFVQQAAELAMAANLTLLEALSALGIPTELATTWSSWYEPSSPYGTGINNTRDAFYKLATDITFGCSSGIVANLTSNLLEVPVWEYVYDAIVPSMTWEQWPDIGAWHAGELALLFGTYKRENSTEVDARVSEVMQKQFADFIKDPLRGPGWEKWPQVGILSVADGQAVTRTQGAMEHNPVCAEYERFWMSSQLPALEGRPELQETETSQSPSEAEVASSAARYLQSFETGIFLGLALSVTMLI